MPITTSDYDAVLKDYYTDDKVQQQVYQENPLLAMMPKERAGGRRVPVPVRYGRPGGASASFTNAAANAATSKSKFEDFMLSRKIQYQRVELANELIYATESVRDSFRKAFDEFDDGFRSLGEKLSKRLYRAGSGSVGRMANTAVNNSTITLADKADAFNFQIGDILQFSDADGGGALRNAGATVEISAVDHEAGTLTTSTVLNVSVAAIATTDYIFHQGDYDACLSGFEDWLPINNRSTKLAAAFQGVTRSVAPVHLGGVYMDGTAMGGIDEILIKLVGKIAKYGGRTSHIFMNPETISDMQLLSNSKLRTEPLEKKIMLPGGEIVVGFSGFKVQVGSRLVSVFGDRSCPSNRIWALQMDTWKIYHAGKEINWLGEELTGTKFTRSTTSDAMYSDLGAYMNAACNAPAWNGGASIPVSST